MALSRGRLVKLTKLVMSSSDGSAMMPVHVAALESSKNTKSL
jgi:hypothetical protein